MDDVKQYIYGTIILFVLGVVAWVSFVSYNACGLSFACKRALPKVERTSMPTLVPGTLPAFVQSSQKGQCKVGATDLIGAWVNANTPEKDEFTFTDINGQTCAATFEKDIQHLFVESNVWYQGSLSCTSCHNADLTSSDAQLDMTTYASMMKGSHRMNLTVQGDDIFGGGNWQKSKLYELMVTHSVTAAGHPADLSASGPVVYAGTPLEIPTETPQP